MIDFVQRYNQPFQSSSGKTPEFIAWANSAKKWFVAWCKAHDAELSYWNVNHFEVSGFITMKYGRIWYFNSGDVRTKFSRSLLVRTAKHLKDWTGGRNQFVGFDDNFEKSFNYLIKNQEGDIS